MKITLYVNNAQESRIVNGALEQIAVLRDIEIAKERAFFCVSREVVSSEVPPVPIGQAIDEAKAEAPAPAAVKTRKPRKTAVAEPIASVLTSPAVAPAPAAVPVLVEAEKQAAVATEAEATVALQAFLATNPLPKAREIIDSIRPGARVKDLTPEERGTLVAKVRKA